MMLLRQIVLACCVIGLTACRAPQELPEAPSPPAAYLPAAVSADVSVAAPALLQLERNAAAARDAATLAALWTEDARMVDGRNTVAPADDYTWTGRGAILDRYRLAVFPAPPPPMAELPAPDIVMTETARAVVTNGGDRWTLVRVAGRWYLQELVYQMP
ncbi:MAG: hypothetical protein KDE20_27055 [Caldilineaceae bacterium]|nr:hypothetical protein [Caldilineaceae bacterium]